ncbi:MAG: hypothetical protein U0232_00585 [Thermomicrobiales bacterium]
MLADGLAERGSPMAGALRRAMATGRRSGRRPDAGRPVEWRRRGCSDLVHDFGA